MVESLMAKDSVTESKEEKVQVLSKEVVVLLAQLQSEYLTWLFLNGNAQYDSFYYLGVLDGSFGSFKLHADSGVLFVKV